MTEDQKGLPLNWWLVRPVGKRGGGRGAQRRTQRPEARVPARCPSVWCAHAEEPIAARSNTAGVLDVNTRPCAARWRPALPACSPKTGAGARWCQMKLAHPPSSAARQNGPPGRTLERVLEEAEAGARGVDGASDAAQGREAKDLRNVRRHGGVQERAKGRIEGEGGELDVQVVDEDKGAVDDAEDVGEVQRVDQTQPVHAVVDDGDLPM